MKNDPASHRGTQQSTGSKAHLGAAALRDVAFSHGRTAVLGGVTLSIAAGEHVAIVGPSGAGKSTLLHLIAGLLKPAAGRILIDGAPLAGPAQGAVLMFQRPALLPWASARDNVLLPLRFSGSFRRDPAAARRNVAALFEQIGLAERIDALPAELSGGQQQARGAGARARRRSQYPAAGRAVLRARSANPRSAARGCAPAHRRARRHAGDGDA